MVLYDTQKDDDSILRNYQDMDILLLPARVICKTQSVSCFCKTDVFGLPPFYKRGAKIVILAGQTLLIQSKGTCRKSSVLLRAYFKM